jgi:hypothetical protein
VGSWPERRHLEFEKLGGGYTGRMLINGEIYTPRGDEDLLKVQNLLRSGKKGTARRYGWSRKQRLYRGLFSASIAGSPLYSTRAIADSTSMPTRPCLAAAGVGWSRRVWAFKLFPTCCAVKKRSRGLANCMGA